VQGLRDQPEPEDDPRARPLGEVGVDRNDAALGVPQK